jgi:Beta-lactamase class C and other penicillin binding proteins
MADVENRVLCHPDTVMRIASISKSLTMAVVAKLWQDGKLDLDKPIQSYVPSFPTKTFNKEQVCPTTLYICRNCFTNYEECLTTHCVNISYPLHAKCYFFR